MLIFMAAGWLPRSDQLIIDRVPERAGTPRAMPDRLAA
jgi:hypothetical protein